jgi:T5orf172 domain
MPNRVIREGILSSERVDQLDAASEVFYRRLMSKFGFVYILGNSAMPGRWKVGFTTASPFERASVLSRATGVPNQFAVVGFVAFRDPIKHERWMHDRFAALRCHDKEFFQCPLRVLWSALSEHEDRQAVCDVEIGAWVEDDERAA